MEKICSPAQPFPARDGQLHIFRPPKIVLCLPKTLASRHKSITLCVGDDDHGDTPPHLQYLRGKLWDHRHNGRSADPLDQRRSRQSSFARAYLPKGDGA
jgi:hypothetical protein